MNHYDLIAFDLDGTLAESKSPLEEEMSELLCELLSDKKVVVASGASFSQFEKQFLSKFSCDNENLKNLYLLPTNGSALYEYERGKWKPVYKIEFEVTEAEEIFSAFHKALEEGGYARPEKIYGTVIENRGSQITFSALGSTAPLSEKEVWDPDHKKRERIVKILREILPEFSISIGGTTSIDITKSGISKAYGLRRLLRHLDIPKERLLYVGDALFPGGNDASALTLQAKCASVKNVSATKELIRNLLGGLPIPAF